MAFLQASHIVEPERPATAEKAAGSKARARGLSSVMCVRACVFYHASTISTKDRMTSTVSSFALLLNKHLHLDVVASQDPRVM